MEFINNSYFIFVSVALFVMSSLMYIRELLKQQRHYIQIQKVKEMEDKKKRDFISNINHEVRTPVNVISGMLHLLARQDLDEQSMSYVEKIKLANKDIKNVIDNALDFNKLYGGDIEVHNKEINFKSFVDSLREDFYLQAKQKGLKLIFNIDENAPKRINSDEYLLKAICSKLINNAIKFTEEGEVIFKVNLLQANDSVVNLNFEVIDTGIGMDKEQIQAIFKAFEQGDGSKTRTYGGIGIGLFLTEKMLEAMKSKIRIQTTLGQGSSFSFSLVLEYIADDLSDAEICRGKKIMFVDDDLINRQIGQTLLNDLNVNSVILSSGEEALENLNDSFDLLIVDIQMPGINGMEVAEKIKGQGYNDLPIIALTGNSDAADLEKYKRSGMSGCIAKPIDFDVLKGTIADAFKNTNTVSSFKKISKDVLDFDSDVSSFSAAKGLRLINNDKSLFNDILTKFVKNFEDTPNKLKYLSETKDFKSATLIAHSIKGISASIGAVPLSNLAKDVEQKFKISSKADIDEFVKEHKIVIEEIKKYLSNNQIEEAPVEKKEGGVKDLVDLLIELQDNVSRNDPVRSKQILQKINTYSFSVSIKDSLSKLKEFISSYDFVEASKVIEEMRKTLEE
ncbi:MAG: ATP-binding protein [Alphaproteobacteria bacterium]|nr:ATP-binding protein [Alphaproteobacteria bacterium]